MRFSRHVRSGRRCLILGLILGLMTAGTSGCSSMILKMQADFMAPMISEMVDQVTATENIRVMREGIAANTLLISSLVEISPNNLTYLEQASFAYCAYGMMVEEEDPEFAAELYQTGKKYGLRGLNTNRDFRKSRAQGKPIPKLTGVFDEDYAPLVCWTAMNNGLWILMNMDDSAALVELADAIALAERTIELDEDYFYGVPKAFLAAYYAFVPDFYGTGGGPDASRRMFEKARAVTDGRLLLVDVFEARFLKTQLKDREGFVRQLEAVLAAEPDILEDGRLLTEMAKFKARYYLAHIDEFF
ncbi:MAG: TRAP transporter TatT component family protein [Thermodesulfobacteriota bacterium]|nr:TRAP transporter TatT component family protein [Thermodesulfobacteriota bacterium]